VMEIRSCCPECVVAIICDLIGGNLSNVVLVVVRC
jgi:hypothetical protein